MTADLHLRREIIRTVQRFATADLGAGTAGNLSARNDRGFIITPSGVPYEQLEPEMLVELDDTGEVIAGELLPSSEWRFHKDIYQSHKETGAIVHVHSPFATAIACTRQSIPAFHYVVAIAGGASIPCADYATFGTRELSSNAVKALAGRQACLLANHGMIALGQDIAAAFKMTLEVEALARQYYYSLQIGAAVILDKEEMNIILEKFKTYGEQKKQ